MLDGFNWFHTVLVVLYFLLHRIEYILRYNSRIDIVKDFAVIIENINAIIDNLLFMQEQQAKSNTVLNLLTKEKRQTETGIDNLMSAILKGVVTETTTANICSVFLLYKRKSPDHFHSQGCMLKGFCI